MMQFQKLTPVINDKDNYKDNIYRAAFDFVFKNNELRNIAVSGAYGAGKSSIFESYMHHWKNKEKIIRISLAHFEQLENCGKGTKSQDETSLEAKIINQLVHQIDSSRIKKTSFIARIKANLLQQVLKSLGLSIAILITIFLFFVEKFKLILVNISNKLLFNFFSFLITGDGLLLLSAFLFLIIFLFIFGIAQHSRGNYLLKKISIKDITIDLPDDMTESFFDRYLSEIRYLFESCGSTIVAIEDIDRYFSSSIFEKIRELNTVINFDRKKPIRFFYIIKDDIFTSKDRTKFFDFIIPIVPIIDASNSYSHLRSQLQEGVEGLKLSNRFLRGLSIYIDDMRVLKNIINEFLIYRTELIKQDLTPNKLLALITYKNLFPKDFNDLQVGTGYLHNLIESRDDFAEYILKIDREELENLDRKIEALNREHLQSLDELGALFLQPTAYLESVNGQKVDNYESQSSLFTEIKKYPTKIMGVNNSGRITLDLSSKVSDLQKNVNYSTRKELIDLKLEKGIDNLIKEKSNIESHIQSVHESHLISTLINSKNIDYFLNLRVGNNTQMYKEITDDLHFKIIPFLIRNGMIDGNYKDYLTYFYENELKLQDQTFIRSVFDEIPLSATHKLTNPQGILDVIESVSENNPAFLNMDLFFYVFDNSNTDADKYIMLLKRHKNCELIIDYLKEGKQIDLLIKTLNSSWESFYVDVEISSKWSQEDRNRFLQMELTHENPEVFKDISTRNDIRTDIECDKDLFSNVADENRENIIENLIVIEAKLQDINSLDKADLFLSDIYKNSLYKITIPNVSFWLRYAYNNQEQIEEDSLLSSVLILPTEPLSIYVSDHLDNLVGDILSNCPTVKFSDDQTIIRKILNSCTTSLETKRLYCDHLSSQIEDISKISDIEVIKLLLGNDLVKLNSNNLLALFNAFNKTFADELSMYLTKHENDWVKDKRINSTLYSNELVLEFFNTALNDTSLNKLVTETLLSATKIKITNQTAIVEEEKAKALISSRALVMNNNNLAYIRTNHPNLVLEFEKVNLELFKKVLDTENNTNAQEIVNLLESDINGREQINLLHHVNVKVPYKESYRYPGVKKQIINYLLDTSDIEKLIADPMAQAENLIFSTKTAIVKNIDFVIQNHLALPYTLFTELMITKLISQKNLVEVFVNSMDLYSPKAIRENILILQLSPFDKLFNRKHPKFESNEINLKILSVLEKKGIANMSHISGRLYLRG